MCLWAAANGRVLILEHTPMYQTRYHVRASSSDRLISNEPGKWTLCYSECVVASDPLFQQRSKAGDTRTKAPSPTFTQITEDLLRNQGSRSECRARLLYTWVKNKLSINDCRLSTSGPRLRLLALRRETRTSSQRLRHGHTRRYQLGCPHRRHWLTTVASSSVSIPCPVPASNSF